jgi:putative DNA primase/helicase
VPGAFETIAALIDGAQPFGPWIPPDAEPRVRDGNRRVGSGRQAGAYHSSSTPDVAHAQTLAEKPSDHPEDYLPSDSDAPRNPDSGVVDLNETLAECAKLDHSDTDNGKRLIAYFGHDLTVRAESEVAGGSFLVWAGTHWDIDGGAAGASTKAQLVGPLIVREAEFLQPTPLEADAIRAADKARAELRDAVLLGEEREEQIKEMIAAGKKARAALATRKTNRRKFGVSSKNNGRIEAMKTCAAPHLRRPIEAFNAHQLMVATRTHTLKFVRRADPECPDPDAERFVAAVEATEGHDRDHLLTSVIPCDYIPSARPKRWLAFVERFLPVAETRRTVQQFTGLGITGLPIQRFMLHHGTGANGKSVFLEVITRLLGPSLAIGLPVESITGNATKSGSQAAPDIARLFGKRMVRVLELPQSSPLSVDVVKKLTGGEAIPVRTLFKGFFEFQPVCKPHFSTNGQPTVDDASNGIWRRMTPVEWPVTLAENEQRDFEEVVREMLAEGPAILNWLIEGVLDYLANGFVVSEGIRAGVQSYRDDMDPTGPFVRDCVANVPGAFVQAKTMYEAYVAWSVDASRKPVTNTKFGLLMKHKVKRDDTKRQHRYVDVELHDVPELTEEQRIKAGLAARRPAPSPDYPHQPDPGDIAF